MLNDSIQNTYIFYCFYLHYKIKLKYFFTIRLNALQQRHTHTTLDTNVLK